MLTNSNRALALAAVIVVGSLALAGCSAGTRTGSANATEVTCDFTPPGSATTVNVIAYNSSAIDPFTNTMVSSCTKDDVTLKHDPIDFGGQVTKTQASLAGDSGSYDIIETYSYVIPGFANDGKLVPLNDLYEKYAKTYGLADISETMRAGMSYQGELYAIPMQAQMQVLAYRKDIFDQLGLAAPKTFDDMIAAAEAIQAAGLMTHPIALPWIATWDVATSYNAAMNSLGVEFVTEDGTPTFDTPEAKTALESLAKLTPYMDPQVTTFDQPKVQQQLYNGTAAMAIMFSGRMYDLTQPQNSSHSDAFAFAAPPKATADAPYVYNNLSVDGWSIPFNTKLDKDMLFQMMAASVSEEASTASVPAAYPAREGMVTEKNSPYGKAANDSLAAAMTPVVSPAIPPVTEAIRPILVEVLTGKLGVDEGLKQMQSAAVAAAG
ncbi:ABC transporter substrate-binding protein [uncultured Microbacterium sp.]|uniref:ABC transporter substrate-binding protein n=1 Tax=uncultured Microbacterium sp. TaxID=191216 RepID=UPI0035C95C34